MLSPDLGQSTNRPRLASRYTLMMHAVMMHAATMKNAVMMKNAAAMTRTVMPN